ncbi:MULTISPECIES: phosphatase PAP2 family protein [Olivibacter]|jgi:undecaprenyl-diphosphatase|uniref:Phosphatase PAP2 family protein n=2 Tax=Olivibacter TaxID=376469 RepID=A0ABV6HLG5_9SPHI|nr:MULTISPECIES: phosphatase PAP2 family protein [Olivibacter]MCL4640571.1 phosphatase PAP2 family protein [Olivibacter sp. UJ_SKK_5.1]MDX3914399.1 phosphatase PAP2 family protein [Pseudosphingobacterium sp.]QEL02522.1 phosphatase PAP2 family protein [Olivibacter sp. LS-1]
MKIYTIVFLFFCTSNLFGQSTVDQIDLRILENLAAKRSEQETKAMRIISDANNYVNAAIPAGLFVAGVIDGNKEMRQNAVYIASSTAITALLNFGLKKIFKRPRPFIAHSGFKAVYQPSSYSFPSGHTSASFSTATALSRAYPKWYIIAPSFIWAGTVGYSRMYLGVHNPSDVAAGAILGAGSAFGMGFIRP